MRSNIRNATRSCWMEDSISLWILKVPVLASLLASIGIILLFRFIIQHHTPTLPLSFCLYSSVNSPNTQPPQISNKTYARAHATSAVFLINVVRVLCNKLHPGTAQLAPLALQKALRATLILVNIDRLLCGQQHDETGELVNPVNPRNIDQICALHFPHIQHIYVGTFVWVALYSVAVPAGGWQHFWQSLPDHVSTTD